MLLQRAVPDQRQGIRLFAGTAACAPDPQYLVAALTCGIQQDWQDLFRQDVEHGPVTIEPRDRDPAQSVEVRPLAGMLFEPRAVTLEISEAELPHAPADALAHLSANLAKSRPAHVQPRQGPLQEAHALLVFHGGMIATVRSA